MNLEEVVIPLSRLQRTFLIVSLDYDSTSRRFHLGKWQWVLAAPAACIFLGLIWTAATETVTSHNLLGVIRNANVWMEAMLSIIYNAHNTYAERRLGVGVLRDLLTFNDEFLTTNDDDDDDGNRSAETRTKTLRVENQRRGNMKDIIKKSTKKVKLMTRKALLVCILANVVGIAQWVFLSENVFDCLRHVLIEVPNLIDNVLITKWCVYLFLISGYNCIVFEDLKGIQTRKFSITSKVEFIRKLRREYSRLYFVYREIVETFSSFLVCFVVCQYLRLLWMLYLLTDNLFIGRLFDFHTIYEVAVQIISFCFVVVPCLEVKRKANDIGATISSIYFPHETKVNLEILNFQMQILSQDYNVRPHGAFELNGSLITSVFSTLLVYLVLLIQISRL